MRDLYRPLFLIETPIVFTSLEDLSARIDDPDLDVTPDDFLVPQACLVQAELGGNAGAFDVGAEQLIGTALLAADHLAAPLLLEAVRAVAAEVALVEPVRVVLVEVPGREQVQRQRLHARRRSLEARERRQYRCPFHGSIRIEIMNDVKGSVVESRSARSWARPRCRA